MCFILCHKINSIIRLGGKPRLATPSPVSFQLCHAASFTVKEGKERHLGLAIAILQNILKSQPGFSF